MFNMFSNIEPIVFFDLSFVIFILSVVLGPRVISYVKKALQKFQIRQKGEATFMKLNVAEEDVKSQAREQAGLILEDAKEKALKIISDANLFQNTSKNLFGEQLKEISVAQIKTFEKASYDFLSVSQKELETLKENTIKIINNISKDIENGTLAELKDFTEILKKETFASQKIVEGKIEEDYKAAQKEIEAYRTERLKKVEDQIYEIIRMVSKLVLGKSLTLPEHEQLVIDALNKAKEEGAV